MKKLYILLIGGCLSSLCFGQFSSKMNEYNAPKSSLICAWPTADMYEVPGKKSSGLSTLHFGEKLESLDEAHYNKTDQKVYIKVMGADGKRGWVEENLLVEGERTVMLLNKSRIYLRPQTVSTITDKFFEVGELAVMSSRHKDWVQLTGKAKGKTGWIRGKGNISASASDIELATLMGQAMEEKDILKRREKLEALSKEAAENNRELKEIMENKSEQLTANLPLMADSDLQRTRGGVVWDSSIDLLRPNKPTELNSELYRKRITNPLTNETTEYIIEVGTVSEIKAPSHIKTIYFAYHKTLPKGTKIQLDIPENTGFVELEIVGRLPSASYQIIGLSKICMETVFGTNNPKSATISYKNQH